MLKQHRSRRTLSRPLFQIEQVKNNVKFSETEGHVYLHNDIVDGDMDQFDKETNKSHYRKAYCCCHGNLLELCKTKRILV